MSEDRTDLERAKILLRPLYQRVDRLLDDLWNIVWQNQNPRAGNEHGMTPGEWEALRDSADALSAFLENVQRLRRCPISDASRKERKRV
jgi:hypothetical protein